ncbi:MULTISPECIES: MFS transporter [Bacillaceae]|uniref:MFS transporter n=1 Tax=Bacillaceae TaxID=186817 RepID=UPI0030FBADE6
MVPPIKGANVTCCFHFLSFYFRFKVNTTDNFRNMEARPMLELLKDKIYIRYWLAVVVSFLGDAMTLTAVVYFVGTHTDNPLMISFVFVAQLLPVVIIGPFIGPLIDKYSSRWVMVYSDIYRFLMVFLMVFFYENIPLLLLLVFLQGIGTAFFEPARMSSIPTIVGDHRIPQGIALFQSTIAVIKLGGPVVAGLLLAFQSPKNIFFIDSFTYLISGVLIFSLSILKIDSNKNQPSSNSYLKNLFDGIVEMLKTPILFFMILFLVPVMMAFGMFMTNYKAVMLQVFEVSKIEFGVMEGIFAFGTVIGAVLGSKLLNKMAHYRLLYVSIGVLGFSIICVYFITEISFLSNSLLYPLILWSLVIGLTNALMMVPTSTIFLQHIPEEIRGRGTAIFYSIFNLFLLMGTLIGGYLGGINIVATLIVAGSVLMITALTYPLYRNSTLLVKVRDTIKPKEVSN